jgi:hypothetical protein
VEVGAQADLAGAHLCDHRGHRSMDASVDTEYVQAWAHSELEQFPAVRGCFP